MRLGKRVASLLGKIKKIVRVKTEGAWSRHAVLCKGLDIVIV